MKTRFSALIINLAAVTLPTHAVPKRLDCTSASLHRKYEKMCQVIVDPTKYNRGDYQEINCRGEIANESASGICKNVNPLRQRIMHGNPPLK